MSEGHCPECGGEMEYKRQSECTCHLAPPCSSCTDAILTCKECGCEEAREPEPPSPPKKEYAPYIFKTLEQRIAELDKTQISWVEMSHSSCSMKKVGIYPEGTTREQVEKLVAGTFGGRFNSYGSGRFEYIAYTD